MTSVLGFLLSVACPSENAATQATIGSFYPILLLSGILWPVEGMPYYFQAITWYINCEILICPFYSILLGIRV
jgi:ABC-type multidrug transport system permease subunit